VFKKPQPSSNQVKFGLRFSSEIIVEKSATGSFKAKAVSVTMP
jgi:hypothetical protein